MSTFTPRTGVDPQSEVNFSFQNMWDDRSAFDPQYPRTPNIESDQEERGSVERKESGSSKRQSQSQRQAEIHRLHHDQLSKGQTQLTAPLAAAAAVPPLTPKTSLLGSVTDNLTRSYSRGSDKSKKAISDVRNILQKLSSSDKGSPSTGTPSNELDFTIEMGREREKERERKDRDTELGPDSSYADLTNVPLQSSASPIIRSLSKSNLQMLSDSLSQSIPLPGILSSENGSGMEKIRTENEFKPIGTTAVTQTAQGSPKGTLFEMATNYYAVHLS